MTSCSDCGYFATSFLATSVEALVLGEVQTFIMSVTTIRTISLRTHGLGLFPLSKHCIKPSGNFVHGIWKLSTQSAAAIQQVDGEETLTEELVEEVGEDSADWLWPSLVCAVKNGINKMYLNNVSSLVTDLLQKMLTYWFVSRQLPIFLLELVSVWKGDQLPE